VPFGIAVKAEVRYGDVSELAVGAVGEVNPDLAGLVSVFDNLNRCGVDSECLRNDLAQSADVSDTGVVPELHEYRDHSTFGVPHWSKLRIFARSSLTP
jgi:hypothetical protein